MVQGDRYSNCCKDIAIAIVNRPWQYRLPNVHRNYVLLKGHSNVDLLNSHFIVQLPNGHQIGELPNSDRKSELANGDGKDDRNADTAIAMSNWQMAIGMPNC